MDSYTLWHNPNCSKSRKTLALLEEHNITPTIRLYAEDIPSSEEIRNVCMMLGMLPADMTRVTEKPCKKIDVYDMDDEDLCDFLSANPIAIQRPICIKNNEEAVIGRPPENILDLIS